MRLRPGGSEVIVSCHARQHVVPDNVGQGLVPHQTGLQIHKDTERQLPLRTTNQSPAHIFRHLTFHLLRRSEGFLTCGQLPGGLGTEQTAVTEHAQILRPLLHDGFTLRGLFRRGELLRQMQGLARLGVGRPFIILRQIVGEGAACRRRCGRLHAFPEAGGHLQEVAEFSGAVNRAELLCVEEVEYAMNQRYQGLGIVPAR